MAYGNVNQIRNTLAKISDLLTDQPYKFITNAGDKELKSTTRGLYHRFYNDADFYCLFLTLRTILRSRKTLGDCFSYSNSSGEYKKSVADFNRLFLNTAKEKYNYESHGLKFMFPLPERGSACKRMNLFLRWMIRKDNVDFGLWPHIPTNALIIPLDTHIARVGALLNLTSRKQADWKMAEEITDSLRRFDPNDPVKYDFSLCHWGMENKKNNVFLT